MPVPTTAVLAPVSIEVLEALTGRDELVFGSDEVVHGTGAYHALANYEPGPAHDDWFVEEVRKLSLELGGALYAVSFDGDSPRTTMCEGGVVCSDDERHPADPRELVRRLGLGAMLPPDPREA